MRLLPDRTTARSGGTMPVRSTSFSMRIDFWFHHEAADRLDDHFLLFAEAEIHDDLLIVLWPTWRPASSGRGALE